MRNSKARQWVVSAVRVVDWLTGQLFNVAAFLLGAMVLIIAYDVILRDVFGRPTYWAVDISEYIMLYITMLVVGLLLKEGRHVRITVLYDFLPAKGKAISDAVITALAVVICAVMTWQSADLTWRKFAAGAVIPHTLQIPEWSILVAVPIGMLLLTFYFIRATVTKMLAITGAQASQK